MGERGDLYGSTSSQTHLFIKPHHSPANCIQANVNKIVELNMFLSVVHFSIVFLIGTDILFLTMERKGLTQL